MHENETFGQWLRKERRRAGCTQVDIARLLGCSSRSVSQWERGKQIPASYGQEWIKAHLPSRIHGNAHRGRRIHRPSNRNRVDSLEGEKGGKLDSAEQRSPKPMVVGSIPTPPDSTAFNAPDLESREINLKFGI